MFKPFDFNGDGKTDTLEFLIGSGVLEREKESSDEKEAEENAKNPEKKQ